MGLIELLEGGKQLDPGKQHQVYGAIQEIDLFLRAIEHLKTKEQKEGLQFTLESNRPADANGNGRNMDNPVATGTLQPEKRMPE